MTARGRGNRAISGVRGLGQRRSMGGVIRTVRIIGIIRTTRRIGRIVTSSPVGTRILIAFPGKMLNQGREPPSGVFAKRARGVKCGIPSRHPHKMGDGGSEEKASGECAVPVALSFAVVRGFGRCLDTFH